MRLRPLIAAILGALLSATTVQAASLCASPRQMDGFKTCADVAKAETEAQLVVYSTDPEDGSERVLAGSTSQPAAKASSARCTMSPTAAAPSIDRSSANTTP